MISVVTACRLTQLKKLLIPFQDVAQVKYHLDLTTGTMHLSRVLAQDIFVEGGINRTFEILRKCGWATKIKIEMPASCCRNRHGRCGMYFKIKENGFMLILKKPHLGSDGKLHDPPSWNLWDCLTIVDEAAKESQDCIVKALNQFLD